LTIIVQTYFIFDDNGSTNKFYTLNTKKEGYYSFKPTHQRMQYLPPDLQIICNIYHLICTCKSNGTYFIRVC